MLRKECNRQRKLRVVVHYGKTKFGFNGKSPDAWCGGVGSGLVSSFGMLHRFYDRVVRLMKMKMVKTLLKRLLAKEVGNVRIDFSMFEQC